MPSNNQIIVVSENGHRGAIAMMTLQMMGYESVRNLRGGAEAIQSQQQTPSDNAAGNGG